MITPKLIHLREMFLMLVFRIPPDEVLNPVPVQSTGTDTPALARNLKQTANQIKSEVIDQVSGLVNYEKLQQSAIYQQYVNELIPQLQQLDLAVMTDVPSAISFWINLYNTLTLHAVIEYGITKSIADGGLGNHLRFFRQAAYNIGGMRFSLEDIEHGILRANAGNPFQFSRNFAPDDDRMAHVLTPVDPRIHFALNCASNSCPPIGFYDADQLEAQLDLASASFIQNETELRDDGMHISRLFSWYKRDFGGDTGVKDFILRYMPEDDRKQWLLAKSTKPGFRYLPYDWGLNKVK